MSETGMTLMESALSVDQVIKQRELVLEVMGKAMKKDYHYGTIPGCGPKPTLLQAGAQTLCQMFQLSPEYKINERELSDGRHREYEVICTLCVRRVLKDDAGAATVVSVPVGQGVGMCSSRETKYLMRNAAKEVILTEHSIPRTYWDIKRKDAQAAEKMLRTILDGEYDGMTIAPKKTEIGEWVIAVLAGGDEKTENSNPTDTYNTVLKMAKKRAFVDATITATASNDLFTQDTEDMRANELAQKAGGEPKDKPQERQEDRQSSTQQGLTGWRKVEIHFGKLKGKKLGELAENQLEWFHGKMLENQKEKGDNMYKADKILLTALEMRKAETESKKKPFADGDEIPYDDKPDSGEFVKFVQHHNVDPEKLLALMRKKNWSSAARLDMVTPTQAEDIVENWETIIAEYEEDLK